MTPTAIPTAEVQSTEPNPSHPGHTLITVTCPHCGRRHHHGDAEDSGPDYGHRSADCGARGGYYVRDYRADAPGPGTWLAAAEHLARAHNDGHLAVLRFTTGWKAVLGTPDIYSQHGRVALAVLPSAATAEDACRDLVRRERVAR